MPIVIRPETNFMRLLPISDILINPTNAVGAMTTGLSLEFRERFPNMFNEYSLLCASGGFHVGDILITKEQNKTIINCSTRRHYVDMSELEDIISCLKKIREYLLTRPFDVVAMVIMGAGHGKEGQDLVLPHMYEILDELPNIINLSVRPDSLEKEPKYLGIVGSRFFTDFQIIDDGVFYALREWNISLDDIDAIISGGAKGVDTLADEFARKYNKKLFAVCANWDEYGKSAGFRRNPVISDISHMVVAFPGKSSTGTRHTIECVENYNKKCEDINSYKLLKVIEV